MRKSRAWKAPLENNVTVDGVLREMGMLDTHRRVHAMDTAYTARIEELIAGGLRARDGEGGGGATLGDSLDRAQEAYSRGLFHQMPLPFDLPDAKRRGTEDLIRALEAHVPQVWVEPQGAYIDVREVIESGRQGDIFAALAWLADEARIAREHADHRNWCHQVFVEVAGRLRGAEPVAAE